MEPILPSAEERDTSQGMPLSLFDDSAQSFTFATKLRNSENEVEVDFDFGEKPVFRERISVLVGRNGAGKTHFLKSLIDGMITDANEEEAEHSPRFTPPVKFHRTLVFSSVPTDPFPHHIGAWRGIDYDYFPLNTARNDGSESLLRGLVALRFEGKGIQLEGGEEVPRMNLLGEVLERLNLKKLCLPLRKRQVGDDLPNIFEIGGNSYLPISRILNETNTLAAYHQIEWSSSPIVMDDVGALRDLSSGELAMLRFSAQAIAAIETGSLLLLDEPETHLHPKFVTDLIQDLYSLLKATKSIAIIATHSAYVVREVSRENVKVMGVKDGLLSFDTPRMQTFGASIAPYLNSLAVTPTSDTISNEYLLIGPSRLSQI